VTDRDLFEEAGQIGAGYLSGRRGSNARKW